MRRSPHVRLTLLPWLATLALAHLQSGCAEAWENVDEPEDVEAAQCGPDEVPVDPKNCPDVPDGSLCCAEEVAIADSVGDEAYLGVAGPGPGIVRVRRGGFGHYFWSGGG